MGDLRTEMRETQLGYLKDFLQDGKSVLIRQAGPMCISDTDDTNLGSFLIVGAGSADDIEEFRNNDVFTKAGVYGTVDLRWDKAHRLPIERSVFSVFEAGPVDQQGPLRQCYSV